MVSKSEEYTITYRLATIVAVTMSLYHILYVARIFDYLGIFMFIYVHRAFHVAFALSLVFLLYPTTKKPARVRIPWYPIILAFVAIIMPLYVGFASDMRRWTFQGLTDIELILGIVGLVMLFEAGRRVIGWSMPLLALIFFLYIIYGNYFPGFLHHGGFSLADTISALVYSEFGIFGSITGVSATILIMFILFGQFLVISGAGDFFINISNALMGQYRGGPAKVAIVASMLFGMISGSTSANVATTGTFTIPLMKRLGYKPAFAGAVEAVASNGGQFTPPIMGTVAFVMAEWLGMPYWSVAIAAAIPALLYYIALYTFVDMEALRLKLGGIPSDQKPLLKNTLKAGWACLLPIVTLIYFIAVLRFSAQLSALYSIAIIVVVSMFRKETRIGLRKLMAALKSGATAGLQVYLGCITAGVIASTIMLTGLGPKLTSIILNLAGGNLFVILLFSAVTCFILGTEMPTLAIYLILVTLVTPALAELGIPPLAAHMFILWWGLTAKITPPVCVAVFVASAIAESKIWATGFMAMRLGILTYILPFFWIYQPALLLMGSPLEIVSVTAISLLVVLMLGSAIGGYMLKWWQRVLLLGSASLMLTFNWAFVGISIAVGIFVFLSYRWTRRLKKIEYAR